MKNKQLFTLLSITVIFVFITSLVSTVNVLADDSTPPASTEEPVSTEEPAATEEPVSTEESVATDVPVATDVSVVTDVPAEDITVPEVLDQLPDGTDLVVLDQNGEALPLASEEAADVLASGDPYFDDGTQIVGFSVSGSCPPIVDLCTADPNPIQAAVDAFAASSAPIGNIIVEADSYAENVTIDGTGNLTNLTGIIGAGSSSTTLDGSFEISNMNAFTLDGFTVNGQVYAHDNYGTLTLNDLIVTNTSGDGIYVEDQNGDVNLTSVNSSGNDGYGAYIRTDDGDVSITDNSYFSGNDSDGLNIGAYTGSVTLDDTTANENLGAGAVIRTSGGGAVSVDNSYFEDNYYEGLKIRTYDSGGSINSGNVTLYNVHANWNNWYDDAYANADIKTYGGNVDITDSEFSDNYHLSDCDPNCSWGGDGLDVYAYEGGPDGTSGNITLNGVTADDNYYSGAYLENGCGCGTGTGNIFIGSSFFDFNGKDSEGRGLIAHSNGDITLASVSASENSGGGAELVNCFFNGSDCDNTNPAKITITGTNTFNDNGFNLYPSVGLWVESNSGVTLDGVTSRGNGLGLGGGAFIGTYSGNISITNSNFSDNCKYCEFGFGFIAVDGEGDITLNRVTANGNGNDPINGYTDPAIGLGAVIVNLSGNTLVKNSDFSSNCTLEDCFGVGIGVLSFGSVYFDHVTASGNGTDFGFGAAITANNNIDIYCSTFNNNAGFGLQAEIPGGSVMTLNDVTLSGNVVDPMIFYGTLVENPFVDCNPGGGGGREKKPVPVSAGVCVGLAANASFKTPKGDFATFPCPINDQVSVQLLDEDKLPGKLGDGQKFLSALVTNVIRDNKPVDELENAALISFIIPEGVDQTSLAILFWDGTQWTELGGELSADGLRFEVSTRLVGTFVLVQK